MPLSQRYELVIGERHMPDLRNLCALKSACRQCDMRVGHAQRTGFDRRFSRLDARVKVAVRGDVPCRVINRKQPEQRKAGLELKDQKVTGFKVLWHFSRLAYELALPIKSRNEN